MSAALLASKSFVDATCQPAPGFGRFAWLEPANGLAFWPVLCQSARSPLSFTHKRSAAPLGLLPVGIISFPVLSKSAIAAMCQVGPVNARLTPFGAAASRPPLPSSSQIALFPKLSNRNRSPTEPKTLPGGSTGKSPLKFPRKRSVIVVMTAPPSALAHLGTKSIAWIWAREKGQPEDESRHRQPLAYAYRCDTRLEAIHVFNLQPIL